MPEIGAILEKIECILLISETVVILETISQRSHLLWRYCKMLNYYKLMENSLSFRVSMISVVSSLVAVLACSDMSFLWALDVCKISRPILIKVLQFAVSFRLPVRFRNIGGDKFEVIRKYCLEWVGLGCLVLSWFRILLFRPCMFLHEIQGVCVWIRALDTGLQRAISRADWHVLFTIA